MLGRQGGPSAMEGTAVPEAAYLSSFPTCFFFPPLCLFPCQTTDVCCSFLMSFHFLSSVMRRNPFGVDICCRKGSRSPLQELYNPTQVSPEASSLSPRLDLGARGGGGEWGGDGKLQNSVLWGFETSLHCLALHLQRLLSGSPFLCTVVRIRHFRGVVLE